MEKSIVSIAKGKDVGEMVHEVLAPLGGVGALIRPKSTVVIKPNAGHAAPAETSVNTNPELVAAVVREIRKAEPKEIILAESSASMQKCIAFSGRYYFLFRETDPDLYPAYCDPPDCTAQAEALLQHLIDSRMLKWVLGRNKPVVLAGIEPGTQLLVHAMTTHARTRGLFIGVLDEAFKNIPDIPLALATIVR